ncbi:hypothetical protein [Actinomadura alba]|uniref:SUKH-4 immunity protein n=1 Tax=Actinomadura alba TaxID=406431 RepID=A0ABR7LUB7_9ACTN|nr:hypothetical protein [Actinomadura alba]MBC6468439.1 hypothetical protein [Actinomadura alba]
MNESRSRGLAEIRSKLDLLRQVEAKHGFGVTIDGPRELEPIPALPDGVTDVFGVFHRLAGNYFSFRQPDEMASRSAWAERRIDPYCPLGNPLVIGHERYEMPPDLRDDIEGGNGIYLDVENGDVYYCDGDDYAFAYEHPDVELVETTELSSDVVTFFNFHVLGAGYPELVEAVLGRHAVTRRDRKGRHRDNWMRLLVESGLASDAATPRGRLTS